MYYALLVTPWAVLPAELLHGLTFAAMWAACVKHGSDIAPPGLAATMQGIVSGVWSGLGRSCGNIVGGILHTHFGHKWMFLLTALWAVFGLTFFFMSVQIMKCMGREKDEEAEPDKVQILGGDESLSDSSYVSDSSLSSSSELD